MELNHPQRGGNFMAIPGRKPSLTAARTSERAVANERTPPGRVLDVHKPDDLAPHVSEAWDYIVPWVAKSSVLAPTDLFMLRRLAETAGRVLLYERQWNEYAERGTVVEHDRNGKPHEVPFIGSGIEKRVRASLASAQRELDSLASSFGLTPTDRMRLGLVESGDVGSFLKALKGES